MIASIRSFTAGDQSALNKVINVVCGEGHWMSTRRFEPTPAWTHALTQPDCARHRLLVAEIALSVAGWCRVFPIRPCNGYQLEAGLGIGLLEPYRNQGIGTRLVLNALHWAEAIGLSCVTLAARSDNARAIHVFEKCGYRAAGYTPEGLMRMRCSLGSLRPLAEGEVTRDSLA